MTEENEDKVLVACPTYSGLSASLDRYIAAYRELVWPNRGLLLVDNTRDGGVYARDVIAPHMDGERMMVRHIEPSDTFEETFFNSWKVMLAHAEANGYQFILSLEQDVIVPPLGLDALLNIAGYCRSPFVAHMYPFHHGRAGLYEGLGCVLMATRLVKTALEVTYREVPYVEAALYDCATRVNRVTLRDLFEIEHLDFGPEKTWQYDVDDPDPSVAVVIEST